MYAKIILKDYHNGFKLVRHQVVMSYRLYGLTSRVRLQPLRLH